MRAVVLMSFFSLFAISPPPRVKRNRNRHKPSSPARSKRFKSGQDAAAYSHASPMIKGFFPDVNMFMGMVKRGYQPVYNPKSYDFGRAKNRTMERSVQEVLITGPDGKPWTALYEMTREPDERGKSTAYSFCRETIRQPRARTLNRRQITFCPALLVSSQKSLNRPASIASRTLCIRY